MSTKETVVSTAGPNAVSTAVAPSNSHIEFAQARLQELRKMRAMIPRLIINLLPQERSRLNNAASVPPEFVELTNVAVANETSLVRGDALTPAEVRDMTGYADAYDPFADELEAFAQFVRHSVNSARYHAGSEALTTYALAQRLAKRPATAHLAPYVADMRRALGRMRKVKAEERKQREAEKAAAAVASTIQPS
ncbi:MAG TPA: hypothetical protein VGF48_18305 [Thermoanaerobaculia bacterium]